MTTDGPAGGRPGRACAGVGAAGAASGGFGFGGGSGGFGAKEGEQTDGPATRRAWSLRWLLTASLLPLLWAACATAPVADWQLNARSALDRAGAAYLAGDRRVEAAEFARARAGVARTGRADLLATLELSRCAWRVASLAFDDSGCAGYDALATDAGPAARAYADYLAGRGSASDAPLLPAPQRRAASIAAASEPAGGTANSATGRAADGAAGAVVAGIDDPLSRLVAAGVLLRRGAADPAVLAAAVDTASAQGWRRPLLAWLHAERLRAEAAGDADAAARAGRRIARIEAPPAGAPSAPAATASASAAPAP